MKPRLLLVLCLALGACGGDDDTAPPPGDGAADGSGNDGSSSDGAPADMSSADSPAADAATGSTPCGDGLECDRQTEVCVRHAGGPGFSYACEAVPEGCETDRTCACVAATLCSGAYEECIDQGDNSVSCDCPVCV